MYCRRCYAPVSPDDAPKCRKCGREFDPEDAKTFLRRPFPSGLRIARQIIFTTMVGVLAAFVVASHQMARTSGH
jgi:hypothetical protein